VTAAVWTWKNAFAPLTAIGAILVTCDVVPVPVNSVGVVVPGRPATYIADTDDEMTAEMTKFCETPLM
jgi:hypothetical protein